MKKNMERVEKGRLPPSWVHETFLDTAFVYFRLHQDKLKSRDRKSEDLSSSLSVSPTPISRSRALFKNLLSMPSDNSRCLLEAPETLAPDWT